jgi:AcrR family transcriptional regulator
VAAKVKGAAIDKASPLPLKKPVEGEGEVLRLDVHEEATPADSSVLSMSATRSIQSVDRYTYPAKAEKYSHPPKQLRSLKSFEQVLDAATELLEKHGFDGFSIVDVSRRSKISIGSIYGRVAGKDDLVRSVQERALNRADKEHDAFLEEIGRDESTLAELFPLAVQSHAEFLAEYAGLFHAFILRASSDPVLSKRGKRSHAHFTNGFCKLLLRHRSEITHPQPERAVLACTRLLWSSFGSFLGLDNDESAGEGDWHELIEDVTQMGLLYLMSKDHSSFLPLAKAT